MQIWMLKQDERGPQIRQRSLQVIQRQIMIQNLPRGLWTRLEWRKDGTDGA